MVVRKQNFVKNSLRVFDEASVSKLWAYVDGVKNDLTAKEKEATATPAAAAVAQVTAAAEEPKEETAATTEPARKSSKKGICRLTRRQRLLYNKRAGRNVCVEEEQEQTLYVGHYSGTGMGVTVHVKTSGKLPRILCFGV